MYFLRFFCPIVHSSKSEASYLKKMGFCFLEIWEYLLVGDGGYWVLVPENWVGVRFVSVIGVCRHARCLSLKLYNNRDKWHLAAHVWCAFMQLLHVRNQETCKCIYKVYTSIYTAGGSWRCIFGFDFCFRINYGFSGNLSR